MKARVRLATFACMSIFLLLFINTDVYKFMRNADIDSIQLNLNNQVWLIAVVIMVIMIIQNLLPVLPLFLFVSIQVALFGFVKGFLWSWMSSVVGGLIAFWLFRSWFQKMIIGLVKKDLKRRFESNGFWYVLLGRLIPIMPTSVINIAAGTSTMRFRSFLWASLLGNFIYVLVLSAISARLFALDRYGSYETVLIVLVAVGIFGYVIWKRILDGNLKKGPSHKSMER